MLQKVPIPGETKQFCLPHPIKEAAADAGGNQSIDRDQCTNTRTMQQGKTRPNYRQTREEVKNPNNAWHSLPISPSPGVCDEYPQRHRVASPGGGRLVGADGRALLNVEHQPRQVAQDEQSHDDEQDAGLPDNCFTVELVLQRK